MTTPQVCGRQVRQGHDVPVGQVLLSLPAGVCAEFATLAHILMMQKLCEHVYRDWVTPRRVKSRPGPSPMLYSAGFDSVTGFAGFSVAVPVLAG